MNTERDKRVLLLDDDQRYLELVEMMLEGEGYTVHTESDGERLYEEALKFKPDVIVMDIMLQQRNGIELANQLRQTEHFAFVPIIFVSAWTGRAEHRSPRYTTRLFKPFSKSELVNAINSALGSTRTIGEVHE